MQNKLQKIFSESRFIPVSNLSGLVLQRVETKIKNIIRMRFYFYSLTSLLSVILLYNSLPVIYSEMTSSWSGSVVVLIFLESLDSLLVIWKDAMYMLVESLPVMSIIILCGVTFMFVMSLQGALIYKKKLHEITF